MRRSFVIAGVLVSGHACLAQTARMDSLWSVWTDTARSENDRGPALFELYAVDTLLDPVTAVARIKPSIPVDQATDQRAFELAWAQGILARRRMNEHRWAEALYLENKSYQSFDRLGRSEWRTLAAMRMGEILTELGQLSKAIPYKTQAIAGFEAIGDSANLNELMGDLAYTYIDIGDTASAIRSFERCLDLSEGRDPGMEKFWLVILTTLAPLSDRSLEYMRRAKELVASGKATDTENNIGEAEGYRLLATGECDSAYELFAHVLEIRQSLGWVSHYPNLLAMKARARLCGHRFREAIELSREGLALAKRDGRKQDVLENVTVLARAHEGAGDYRNALLIWRTWQALRDSFARELSASSLTGSLMTARFEEETRMDSMRTANERALERSGSNATLRRERARRNVFLFSGLGALLFGLVVFRQRNRISKARKRSDELLLNILPEEVAEELKETGAAAAKHFDSATILFTDFKGFTQASEKMSPEELVEELNTCFKAFDNTITAHGIEKIKTIGDAYMCAGGLPDPASSSPAAVVYAALEMQAFMIARKTERDAQGKPSFEMRVGIHTGPVVAGIVGVKKFAYDIWGDTVNIASRMESSGEVGQVNISEATYALVKDAVVEQLPVVSSQPAPGQDPGSGSAPSPDRFGAGAPTTDIQQRTTGKAFTFTPRGKVQAKGKGEMEMFFVEAVKG